jgi:hypothetical protein
MNNDHVEILTKLDVDYVAAAGSKGVEYFGKHLAEDYRCSNTTQKLSRSMTT